MEVVVVVLDAEEEVLDEVLEVERILLEKEVEDEARRPGC